MKIKTDEITSVLKQEIEQFGAELEVSEVGRVVEVGDGIARVYGLAKAMSGELVEFDTSKGPVMGQVMNLELDTVGCVIYGDALAVQEGDTVKATTRLLEVPAGPFSAQCTLRQGRHPADLCRACPCEGVEQKSGGPPSVARPWGVGSDVG